MRAIFWKEIRENIKWALLGMLALGAALCYVLYSTPQGQPEYYSYSSQGITLCKESFLLVTTFGCASLGLLLGLLQILPELKRDRWASLLHRPVPEGTIFWGKAAAGVSLYSVATVLPFSFVVWRVATPGNFGAPFLPEMIKPGAADICAGLAYYFAALVLALQRGGWIGLRVFPILAAVHMSFYMASTTYFRAAVTATAMMGIVLAIAARGEIGRKEGVSSRPWLSRLAFLAILVYGAFGAGDLGRFFLDAAAPPPRTKSIRYKLSRDGFPLRLTYVGNVVTEVSDVGGKPLDDPKFRPDRARNQIDYLNRASSYVGDSHGWKPRSYPSPYRDSDSYIWADSPYDFPRMEQWFFLRKPSYYVCFLPQQKKAVDILGGDGFQPISDPPVPFSPESERNSAGNSNRVLWDAGGARFAFMAQKKIVAAELPASPPIYGVANAWARAGRGSVRVIGIALGEGMAVYDAKARQIAYLPYRQDVGRWGQIDFGINASLDRFYLWYEPSAWIDGKTRKTMPFFLDVMDTAGNVIRTFEMPPLPEFPRGISASEWIRRRLQSPALFFGELAYQKIGASLSSVRLEKALAWRLGGGWNTLRETALWSGSLSAALALIALVLARRAQIPPRRAWGWAGFVLLFNLAGFIAFFLAADRPRLVPCRACERKRPTDGEHCPSCGGAWPAPALTGTEIFDHQEGAEA